MANRVKPLAHPPVKTNGVKPRAETPVKASRVKPVAETPAKASRMKPLAETPAKANRVKPLAQTAAKTNIRRVRRSTDEVRSLILGAASEMFSKGGYAATSTRAISKHCGVAEVLIYRHFGSKAGLFEAAVRQPFEEFIDEFVQFWKAPPPSGDDVSNRASMYVTELYRRLLENRRLLLTLVRDLPLEDGADGDGTGHPLDRYFDVLETFADNSLHQVGWLGVDTHIAVRVSFAMVVGMVVFDEALFPSDRERRDEERILAEMHKFLIHGLAHRSSPLV